MAVPFKDTHEEEPGKQKAHVNFIDREMEDIPIEREDSHIGQTADLNGLALAAVNSKQITVPNELNDMPELRAKYVEGKRMSMLHSDPQNGILTSIARMGLLRGVLRDRLLRVANSANAGTYAVTRRRTCSAPRGSPAGHLRAHREPRRGQQRVLRRPGLRALRGHSGAAEAGDHSVLPRVRVRAQVLDEAAARPGQGLLHQGQQHVRDMPRDNNRAVKSCTIRD